MNDQTHSPGGPPWLAITAGLCILLLGASLFWGWTRAYWYDEVFTIGAAAIGRPLDWNVLLGDVHPPTYVLAVRALGAVFEADSFALRLINIPGLIALFAAILVARPALGKTRTYAFAILLTANLYTLSLMLDLRSYILLLGFSALIQALLLRDRTDRQTAPLILCAAILASLHFFGAALGLAVLAVSMGHHLRRRRYTRALILAIAGAVIFAAFEIWAFGYSRVTDAMGGNLWIKNGAGPWLDFIGWQTPLFILVPLCILSARRLGDAGQMRTEAGDMILPAVMVVVVALAISFHTPVISARNLIVVVPGFSLAAVLLMPDALKVRIATSILVPLIVLPLGLRYAYIATADNQLIRWTVETAMPLGCDGEPIYIQSPGVVDTYAQQIFLGEVKRPMKDFTEYEAPGPACDYIAMGFHEFGTVSSAIAFFEARGTKTRAVPLPSERLHKRNRMTHGFVLERVE